MYLLLFNKVSLLKGNSTKYLATDRSCIALIHWYNSEEDITQYYIKAEPVK